MTTTAGITLHVDWSEVSHAYRPVNGQGGGYGTLDLGMPGPAAHAFVFFHTTAEIDIAIAELVALKQEMAPPVPACESYSLKGNGCTVTESHWLHKDKTGHKWLSPEDDLGGPEAEPVEFTTSSLPWSTSARCLRPGEHSAQMAGAVVDCDVAEHHAITDSERTCDEANPDSGAHCDREGGHGVHEDANEDRWRTDLSGVQDRYADLDAGESGAIRGAGCYDITGRTA